ncbi:MAG: hypothetical protein HC771_16240 [Synechococcales cyanobacterium CRU_2_2]|nr:hypothetical protein [Synechococcales cyanobacterium CRU_2_2]
MTSLDVLIVVLYVTFAVYVSYRARQSFLAGKEAKRVQERAGLIVVRPDQVALDRGLEEQLGPIALQGFISIKLSSGIALDNTLDLLSLTLENRSSTYAVYINWKESWLTNGQGRSRSIARITPNEGISQNHSMIPPERTLKEVFTVMSDKGPQPLQEALILHPLRQSGAKKDPKSSVLLSLSIQLKAVSQFSQSHLLAVSCPIEFSLPGDDEIKAWQTLLQQKRMAKAN